MMYSIIAWRDLVRDSRIDEKTREESGYANSTFKTVFENLEREGSENQPSPYVIIRLL